MRLHAFLLGLVLSTPVFAETTLTAFFSDNMVLQQDSIVAIWGWDEPGVEISIKPGWGGEIHVSTNADGKWQGELRTPSAGGPYRVSVEGGTAITLSNIMIGEVWLCSGQSNMNMPLVGKSNQPVNGSLEHILHSGNDSIRLFQVEEATSTEPLNDVAGTWQVSAPATVAGFGAVCYFFGKQLNAFLDVPIGLIQSTWGGSSAEAWTDRETLSEIGILGQPAQVPADKVQKQPSALFNAMIHPLIPYAIRGVAWYQGESNRVRAEAYQRLFPAMIGAWRKAWNRGAFPFYFVQIAPFGENNHEHGARLREAQLFTHLNTENTGMVVTLDIGDCNNIHPPEKEAVGQRLAYWALANDYGVEAIAYSGPIYRSMTVNEGRAVLSFDHAEMGFSSFGQALDGFEIAGADRRFHPAKARFNKKAEVLVWSERVEQPAAVRYAFKNCAAGSLFNLQGLPASSFRTDDWPRTSD